MQLSYFPSLNFSRFTVHKVTMPPMAVLGTAIMIIFSGCSNTANNTASQETKHTKNTHKSEHNHEGHQLTGNADYVATVDANYPPYGMRDDFGHADGFDADVLRSIAKHQGFTVDILPYSWDVIHEGMFSKNYDIVMGGMSSLDIEQALHLKNYGYSSPYAYGKDAIGTLSNVTNIQTFDDLKNHKVSILGNSSYTSELKEIYDSTSTGKIIEEPSLYLAFQDMIQGKSDAVLSDLGVLEHYKLNFPNADFTIHQKGEYLNEIYPMVYWLNKDKPELQEKIKMGIEQMVADGSYQQIYQKWFGVEPKILPTKAPTTATRQ